jgi:hypothetical protein
MRTALYILILLPCLAAACGDDQILPMPVHQAREINDRLMFTIGEMVKDAVVDAYPEKTFSYECSAGTGMVTGNIEQTGNGNTTQATLTAADMTLSSRRSGSDAYFVTGTLTYANIDYLSGAVPNGESRTQYGSEGVFTITSGLESWEFRWPRLVHEAFYASAGDRQHDLLSFRLSGSFVINGVSYSYSREQD